MQPPVAVRPSRAVARESALFRVMSSRQGVFLYRGGMGGVEATWFGAHGDAIIGSSAPDVILKPSGSNPVIIDKTDFDYNPFAWEFSRKNSSLLNVIYWNGIESGKFHFSGGAWFTIRLPGDGVMNFVNPMPDSVRRKAANELMKDSIVTVRPEVFRAFKLSFFPTYQLGRNPVYLGVRLDNITYLTPAAHTNALELERDQTLRPAGAATGSMYGPSKWDREAVNIVTPSLRLDFKELGGITVAYSHAFYNKPVDRQGVINSQQGNLTISADISLIKKSGKIVLP